MQTASTLTPAQPDTRNAERQHGDTLAIGAYVWTPEGYYARVIGFNVNDRSRVIVRRFDPHTWMRLVDKAYDAVMLRVAEVKTAVAAEAAA